MIDKIRHLLAFSDTPRYNIKAVVQQTQVNVSTLRAWEQRYGVPQPKRTDHGHRLYSQRDIEIIKWLKLATEDGISISQAVVMLREDPDDVQKPEVIVEKVPPRTTIADSGWPDLRTQLFDALVQVNIRQANVLLSTAISLFPVESLVYDVILPIMSDFSKRWVDGTGCMAVEQIAVQIIRQRLTSLLQIHASYTNGPRMIIGSTTDEQHDIGGLIYALMMEQEGWEVLFMGPNLGMTGLADFLVRLSPAVVVLSATMVENVASIQQIGQMVNGLHHHGIHFGYAGRAFVLNPELCLRMPGTYMGDDFRAAVQSAVQLSDEVGMISLGQPAPRQRDAIPVRTRLGL
jgi:DNA-binding transcriptional MerR regulator